MKSRVLTSGAIFNRIYVALNGGSEFQFYAIRLKLMVTAVAIPRPALNNREGELAAGQKLGRFAAARHQIRLGQNLQQCSSVQDPESLLPDSGRDGTRRCSTSSKPKGCRESLVSGAPMTPVIDP